MASLALGDRRKLRGVRGVYGVTGAEKLVGSQMTTRTGMFSASTSCASRVPMVHLRCFERNEHTANLSNSTKCGNDRHYN